MRSKPVEPLASGPPKLTVTPRQREVLMLIVQGHSMKEIAATLNLAPRTVAFHKYKMMEQMGLRTTAELVVYATKHLSDLGT